MPQAMGYQNRRLGKGGAEDFPTPPWATRAFLAHLMPDDLSELTVWEPAANRGYMSRPLAEHFGAVIATDKFDYGAGFPLIDFLDGPSPTDYGMAVDWIITNPPFNAAEDFVRRALNIAEDGVAIFARASWLEGKRRYDTLFRPCPPTWFCPYVERVPIVQGRVDPGAASQMPYAWFVWQKSVTDRDWPSVGKPTLTKWIPPSRKDFEKEGDYDRHGSDLEAVA
jgi:hypothetical protein